MIQSDLTEPFSIATLGWLRAWMRNNHHLPDDTQIQVEGASNGDDEPFLVLAKRTWDKDEQGCLVEFDAYGNRRQVDQTIIVIREWGQ